MLEVPALYRMQGPYIARKARSSYNLSIQNTVEGVVVISTVTTMSNVIVESRRGLDEQFSSTSSTKQTHGGCFERADREDLWNLPQADAGPSHRRDCEDARAANFRDARATILQFGDCARRL